MIERLKFKKKKQWKERKKSRKQERKKCYININEPNSKPIVQSKSTHGIAGSNAVKIQA